MSADRDVPFPYMRWAKRHLTGFTPSNLGMSGIAGLTPVAGSPARPAPAWRVGRGTTGRSYRNAPRVGLAGRAAPERRPKQRRGAGVRTKAWAGDLGVTAGLRLLQFYNERTTPRHHPPTGRATPVTSEVQVTRVPGGATRPPSRHDRPATTGPSATGRGRARDRCALGGRSRTAHPSSPTTSRRRWSWCDRPTCTCRRW